MEATALVLLILLPSVWPHVEGVVAEKERRKVDGSIRLGQLIHHLHVLPAGQVHRSRWYF